MTSTVSPALACPSCGAELATPVKKSVKITMAAVKNIRPTWNQLWANTCLTSAGFTMFIAIHMRMPPMHAIGTMAR